MPNERNSKAAVLAKIDQAECITRDLWSILPQEQKIRILKDMSIVINKYTGSEPTSDTDVLYLLAWTAVGILIHKHEAEIPED